MSQVVGLRSAESRQLAPGVTMRPVFGDNAMLNLLEFEPGGCVEPHQHPHEQLGYIIEGTLVLTIAGVERELGPGDAYQIPGGVEHAARSPRRCLVLDVFQPVREDYRRLVASD